MTKVLLYSGGMDSWLIDKIWKPDVRLYVDIHGAYSAEERRRLPEGTVVVDFPYLGATELPNGFVPLRNLYFLMIASGYGDEVCLGATAGDWGNRDKTPKFLGMAEDIMSELWGDKKVARSVRVCRDFVEVPKTELLETYLSDGGSIEDVRAQTFSCYTPVDGKECLCCYPCFRKFAILLSHGAEYTEEERRRMWGYVRDNIIPTAEEGGYQGTYYTDRGEESVWLAKAVDMLRGEFE